MPPRPSLFVLGGQVLQAKKKKKKVDCEGDEIGYTLFKKLLKIHIDEDGKYNTNSMLVSLCCLAN